MPGSAVFPVAAAPSRRLNVPATSAGADGCVLTAEFHDVPPAGPTWADEMKSCRIHIMGASGAGVTSLGRALADALAIPHHDTDDYFWQPTIPPYQKKREPDERLRLMREVFLPRADWVLSGALDGWGDAIIPEFDLVVFVSTSTELRLQRLRAREAAHFGATAVAPGGWRHRQTEEFVEWASRYDDGDREGRSLARQQAWLTALPCPVLRLDGSRSLPELVAKVRAAL
jgi:adenylate kinase family enzyme